MGLYEDQLAKIQRTEDFLQRQTDLSDPNKSDVLDALINNTWGTTNTFYVHDIEAAKSETSINLEQYLTERGIDPNNIPDYVDSSIFDPIKLETTRLVSLQVPEGEGIDLQLIAQTLDYRTYNSQEADKVISEQDYSNQVKSQEFPIVTSPPNLFNSPVVDPEQPKKSNLGVGVVLLGVAVVAGG